MSDLHISVLLVEDDRDLAASVADYLSLENILCDHAYNGQSGLRLASEGHYDVLLLDLNLPRMDGISVCQNLRQAGVDTPILMLTARDTIDDKATGFRAGTDDYLVKPFSLAELVMRIQALSKRRSGQAQRLVIGDLTLNTQTQSVRRQGKPIKVTPTGYKILELLMRASPAPLSRPVLEQQLWGENPPDSNSLKVHMYQLRKQIDKPFEIPLIHTLSHRGFQIRVSDDEDSQ